MSQLLRVLVYCCFLSFGSSAAWAQSLSDKACADGFSVEPRDDRLLLALGGQNVGEFVFADAEILRPYFSNLRLPSGVQLTRQHPPIAGVDATDHQTMHPGLWLGFGDLNGQDFWRNKATIAHQRFVSEPRLDGEHLQFSTECQLITATGETLGRLSNHYTLMPRPSGWLLIWTATFHADQQALVFGDQEEMGLGVRVATSLTEQNGGRLRNSGGLQTAARTWGQSARWCDYSGVGPGTGGILLMAGPQNFRESWWHNRDYGVFVANPFGRQAMQQGPPSAVTIDRGEQLTLTFGAFFHDEQEFDAEAEFQVFAQATTKRNASDD